MKKKLIYLFIAVSICLASAAIYISSITLPVRLKTSIINAIENTTHKKILIQSLHFNILKGFVIDGPILYDDKSIIMRAKEIRCRFLLPPILENRIIIPYVIIESPSVLVERRSDYSWNLSELIAPIDKSKSDVESVVYKIIVKNGLINFIDKSIDPSFIKVMEKVNLDIRLMLPAKITFNLDGQIRSETPIRIRSRGEYFIKQSESAMEVSAYNLSLWELSAYYTGSGFSFPEGLLDIKASIRIKNGVLDSDIDGTMNGLSIHKDNIISRMDSAFKIAAQYNMAEKRLDYRGNLDIGAMDIDGIDAVGKLDNIKANVRFDNMRLSSDDVRVNIFGIPWKAKINIINFNNPIADIYASTGSRLEVLKVILNDRCGIRVPVDMAGKSDVEFSIHFAPEKQMKLNGYVNLHDAVVGLCGKSFLLEHVNGQTEFTMDNFSWSNLDFTCGGKPYKSSGAITNFSLPGVDLEVKSDNLSFRSILAINDKTITLAQLKGRYFNSDFSVSGEVDLEKPDSIKARVKGALEFELQDLDKINKNVEMVKKIRPEGRLIADFSLNGDMKNIKTCSIDASVKNSRISLYGLKMADVNMDYVQAEGEGRIKSMRSSFYDGSMSVTGKIDWFLKDLPFLLTINAKDVKLEKLKNDTGIRDKDVAGIIKFYTNVNGYLNDLTRTDGLGSAAIKNGKVWQLDLFRGLGMLIFSSDFSNIIFSEGSCDFKIKDKAFYTNNLMMKSDLLMLYGSGKIGFDKSVVASLKSELTEDAMYPGFKRNVASAIGKYTYVEVTGTLADPKYKVRPSVSDIVEDIASGFLRE